MFIFLTRWWCQPSKKIERRKKHIKQQRAKYDETIKNQANLLETSESEYVGRVGHLCNIKWAEAPLHIVMFHGAPTHILENALNIDDENNEKLLHSVIRAIRNTDWQTIKFFSGKSHKIPVLHVEKLVCILFQEGNEQIINAILDHFDRKNYLELHHWEMILRLAIKYDCPVETLNQIDRMTEKRGLLITEQGLKEFYTKLLQHHMCICKPSNALLCNFLIQTGIDRHIVIFKRKIASLCQKNKLQTKSYEALLKHEVLNSKLTRIVQTHIRESASGTTNSTNGSPWSEFKNIHATDIKQQPGAEMELDEVLKIIHSTVTSAPSSKENASIKSDIEVLLRAIVDNLKATGVLWQCDSELVGSGKERTRCIPNEYDFILKFVELARLFDISFNKINHEGKITMKSDLPEEIMKKIESLTVCNVLDNKRFYIDLLQRLNSTKNAVIELCKTYGILIENLRYNIGRSFLFMTVKLAKYPFKISIDLVPSFPFRETIALPKHTKLQSSPQQQYITIKSDFAKSKFNISYSHFEQDLFQGTDLVSEKLKMGYTFAKCMRNYYVIKPTIKKLHDLSIFYDLEELIPSYMLKTCVLWMTRHKIKKYEHYADYCYDIFRQLKEFMEIGEVPNFFMRNIGNVELSRSLFQCQRQRRDTILACCRRKEGIVLVTNQILEVLISEVSQDKRDSILKDTKLCQGLLCFRSCMSKSIHTCCKAQPQISENHHTGVSCSDNASRTNIEMEIATNEEYRLDTFLEHDTSEISDQTVTVHAPVNCHVNLYSEQVHVTTTSTEAESTC